MIMIIDASMPDIDGFELAQSVRDDPAVPVPTIVMLTSAGRRGDAELCRRIGISAYLVKPVRQSDLLEAILGARLQALQPDRPLVTRHSIREAREALDVLIAEDNEFNQVVLETMMRRRRMDGYIAKPLRSAELYRVVRRAGHGAHQSETGGDVNHFSGTATLNAASADTAHMAPAPPAVDRERVLAEAGGDVALLLRLVDTFQKQSASLIERVRRGLHEADPAEVMEAAHALKGSAGFWGKGDTWRAATALERLAGTGSLTGADAQVAALEAALSDLIAELDSFRTEGA